MKDYILKPGAFISKSTTDKTSDVPGLSLEKYIVQVLNGETCCLKNIVADSLTINGIEVGAGLKLKDDALMTTTLTSVVDRDNTASPLKLSTNLVSVGSTLQIATDNTTYIDAEDSLGNNRFTVSRTTGQQVVNVDFASNPTLNTKVGAIRTYQDGVTLTDAISVERNGQTTFTERVKVEADSTATTQSTAVIQSSTTNAGIAIVPNGTGAITASIPDGTATGGNARGQYAVDLQMARGSSAQVASQNYSGILSGANNIISAASDTTYSVISGGLSNSSQRPYTFIGGGSSNSIVNSGGNGERSVISGGGSNTITGASYSTISGGQSNTASTNTHATVVGGQGNTSSGSHSVSGGRNNTASGSGSVALGNTSNGNNAQNQGSFIMNGMPEGSTASGLYATVFGGASLANGEGVFITGYNNQATGSYSISSGLGSKSYLNTQFARANNFFSARGDAQESSIVSKRSAILDSGASTILSAGGLLIPDGSNRVWNVTVKTVAVVTAIAGTATGVTVGDVFMENKSILFKKIGGVSSVVDLATDNTFADGLMGTSSMAYTAGASQELALTYTGPTFAGGGSVTVRVVSKVELVEVAY